MADSGQRTEQPTERRRDRARKEGNFPASREFVSSIQFLVFTALAASFGGAWFFGLLRTARGLFARAFSIELNARSLVALVYGAILPEFAPLLLGGAALV